MGESATNHASVTELELEFAQNPDSEAYIPLCEAYIDQGRFMEAMVVCKKGIKAHPNSVDARVLLARVYAEQKKYKRALQELDDLVEKNGDSGLAHLARGKVRLDSGDEDSAIEDLKKAIDLDSDLVEASEILAGKGIIYPEPEPEPEPITAPVPAPVAPAFDPAAHRAGAVQVVGVDPAAVAAMHAPAYVTNPSVVPMVPGAVMPGTGSGPSGPAMAYAPPMGVPRHRPQLLEGEDELEELARKVAEEKPKTGKPIVTVALLGVLLLLGLSLVAYLVIHKKNIESMDRLTREGEPAFNRDTYGSYKKAAEAFEEIVEEYDSSHPLTLGRLAHTYAILWGEHGETGLKPKLDEILKRALKHAPEVSHTVAAVGLSRLYDGDDRQAAAAEAMKLIEPHVKKLQEAGGAANHASLALAIVELEMGDYDHASRTLGRVSEVLPGSVRAKVWHARAAFRANHFATAQDAYSKALRAEPNHPGAMAGSALVKLERGDLEGAGQDLLKFDEFAQKNPKEISQRDAALAEFARSEILRSAGEDNKAIGAYEQAIRYDPGNADFPYGLGRWLLKNDRAEEAIKPLRKAVEMEKTRWSFLVELAEAEMRTRDYKSAEKHLDTALTKAPDYFPAALAKARLMRRDNRSGTEQYIEDLLKKWPSYKVDVKLELGRYYRGVNKYGEAQKALEEAINNMGHVARIKQAEVLMSYALLMTQMGERATAVNTYKQAGENGDLEAWYRLALLLARGDRDEREEAKKALQRYLAAGSSLKYSKSAQQLYDSMR